MVLNQKKVHCLLLVGNELQPQALQGLVHMRRKAAGDCQVDRCCISSYADVVPVSRGEERTDSDGEAFDFPVNLHSHHHLWSLAQRSDQRNEIVHKSG